MTNGALDRDFVSHVELGLTKDPPTDKLDLLARTLGTTLAAIYSQLGYSGFELPPELSADLKEISELYLRMPKDKQRTAKLVLRDLAGADYVTGDRSNEKESAA